MLPSIITLLLWGIVLGQFIGATEDGILHRNVLSCQIKTCHALCLITRRNVNYLYNTRKFAASWNLTKVPLKHAKVASAFIFNKSQLFASKGK